jgi:hypothetical protein
MKITTVAKPQKDYWTKRYEARKKQRLENNEGYNYWLIWEVKNVPHSDYENHKLYRMNTIAASGLITRERHIKRGNYSEDSNRWLLYKKVKQLKKPLVEFK